MSGYYKVDDVSRAIIELPNAENGYSGSYDKAEILNVLEDLPTIEVSEDCISREYLKSFEYINKGDFNSVETIREWIDNAPSVVPTTEQSSKVGEWIEVDDGRVSCKCSICKEEYLLYEEDVFGRNYCPNCGCDMRGGSTNER